AQVEREFVRLETEADAGTAQTLRVVNALQPLLERAGDDHGLCRIWSLRAQADWTSGRVAAADDAWRQAAECARRGGDQRALFDVLGWRSTAAVFGPAVVDEAITRCEEFRELVAASPIAVLWMLNPLASLRAMRGEFELADQLLEEAQEIRRQLGTLDYSVEHHAAFVWMLADQPERAEVPLREGLEILGPMSSGRILATTTAMLAQAVYARGDLDEARALCRRTEEMAAADDIVTQVIRRSVEAKILARDGRGADAGALAREAVGLVAPTDLLSHHADALLDLADVLRTGGSGQQAIDAALGALELYETKANTTGAERTRVWIAGKNTPR
ncbi:MAG: hypothetical protein H0W96_03340, partial [Solirubrobacterales bacterium]|nr:hypothetical protein [Solirubrobacterales bacterium]